MADTDELDPALSPHTDKNLPTVKLTDVWDKDGAKHRMSELNAMDMVRFCGWHSKAPIIVRQMARDLDKVMKENQPITSKATPSPKITGLPPDLAGMSRDGLVRVAKENFNMEFDANVSHDDILKAIVAQTDHA